MKGSDSPLAHLVNKTTVLRGVLFGENLGRFAPGCSILRLIDDDTGVCNAITSELRALDHLASDEYYMSPKAKANKNGGALSTGGISKAAIHGGSHIACLLHTHPPPAHRPHPRPRPRPRRP